MKFDRSSTPPSATRRRFYVSRLMSSEECEMWMSSVFCSPGTGPKMELAFSLFVSMLTFTC